MDKPITMHSTKAEIFAAYQAAIKPRRHSPMTRLDLARLIACDTPERLAGYIADRLMARACLDPIDTLARELVKSLHLYVDSTRVLARHGVRDPPTDTSDGKRSDAGTVPSA